MGWGYSQEQSQIPTNTTEENRSIPQKPLTVLGLGHHEPFLHPWLNTGRSYPVQFLVRTGMQQPCHVLKIMFHRTAYMDPLVLNILSTSNLSLERNLYLYVTVKLGWIREFLHTPSHGTR